MNKRPFVLLVIAAGLVFMLLGPALAKNLQAADTIIWTGSVPLTSVEQSQSTPQVPAFLSGPNAGDPADIALTYLRQNAATLGLAATDLADVVLKDRYVTRHNGVTHFYYRQRYNSIEVYNGDININISANGAVISLGNRFVSNLAGKVNTSTPTYTASAAVGRAAQTLQLSLTQPLQVISSRDGASQAVTLRGDGISKAAIPAELVYVQQSNGAVRLAWKALLQPPAGDHVWSIGVDAVTGDLIKKVDLVTDSHASAAPAAQPASPLTPPSFRVFALPLEHPEDGIGLPDSQTLLQNPADMEASPFGWLDIDGLPGHEFLDTRGNNVWAQEDHDDDNSGGFRPTGRQPQRFDFDYRFNPEREPVEEPNLSAAIVNLFYWNNILHDIAYQYGFDEASGNFQQNNYDRGGLGGDAVFADAQDAFDLGVRDNANFFTPPDGDSSFGGPRMQMYAFDLTTPNRDSDLDNGIMIHEYMHGISNRLVGGPANVECLFNNESMGEGWSDFLTLALTAKPTDTGARARGMGTYVLGEPADGAGIRRVPYSTDMSIDPQTYDWLKRSGETHDVGEVWATMLWDLHWALVDQYGFDPDLYNGTGGNNLALQLVMDGMKFTPCEPGFVDSRDAILTADQVNNGGANQCAIWAAFARRGLGYSAVQGSSLSTFDGAEAFDLAPVCRDDLSLTKRANPDPAAAGKPLTYELVAANYTADILTGVVISDIVPASTIYIPGSASDGGSEVGGVVSWPPVTLNPDQTITRTFQVTVDANFPDPISIFFDDMESGGDNWTGSGLWHLQNDAETCGNSFSPVTSWYYGHGPDCVYDNDSVGALTTTLPIVLPAGQVTLQFMSWENVEVGFEQLTVLVSTDGVNFDPVWGTNYSAVGTWYAATADLSAYAGQSVWLAFSFAADFSVNAPGWYVDDVQVIWAPTLTNSATLTSNEGESATATIQTPVVKLPDIEISPAAFTETVKLGEQVVRTLTISNTGTAPLTFQLTERDTSSVTVALPAAAANPPVAAANRDVRTYAGDRPTAQNRVATGPKAGAFTTAASATVLLVAAADVAQIQAILQAYPDLPVVETFDARLGTPTLDQLLGYDVAVVIAGSSFADPVAVGNVLADYLDAGGGVVQTVPTFFDPDGAGWGLRGRFIDEGYSPFTGVGDWFLFASLGEFDATHPIMQGVSSAGDELRQVMEVTADASVVAAWTDDEFVGTKNKVVALNTYLADGSAWIGDVDLIVHNSIIWLQEQGGGGDAAWLNTTPVSGTLTPGAAQTIQVTFDAGAVEQVGDYSALLKIRSNDPNERTIDVPIALHVIGPTLSLTSLAPTYAGRPVQVAVNLTSEGFSLAAAIFSVDFDETCLRFDPTDSDGNGLPDAITWQTPADFNITSATADLSDTDGELDFFIADSALPLASLLDGTLATITFNALCLPTDAALDVRVGFSTAPKATFSDPNGASIIAATQAGSVTIQPGLPGDCNQDGRVDAGDTISCVLEIFDEDGTFWLDAPGGAFAGSPQGCDSNQDNQIEAADLICTMLIAFQGPDACRAAVSAVSGAAATAATLSIPSAIAAQADGQVAVPIQFTGSGNAVAATTFAISYDQTRLHLDPTDSNSDGIPDAVVFNVPAGFVTQVKVSANGQLQFAIVDLALPLATIPDGTMATIHFTVKSPAAGEASVGFATDLAASLGGTSGQRVAVSTQAGSVVTGSSADEKEEEEENAAYRLYLPAITR